MLNPRRLQLWLRGRAERSVPPWDTRTGRRHVRLLRVYRSRRFAPCHPLRGRRSGLSHCRGTETGRRVSCGQWNVCCFPRRTCVMVVWIYNWGLIGCKQPVQYVRIAMNRPASDSVRLSTGRTCTSRSDAEWSRAGYSPTFQSFSCRMEPTR